MFIQPLLRRLGHQKWIRFGIRDRIIRAFHNPDTSLSQPFTVPFFGRIYTGDFSVWLDWCTYYFGAYSGEELDLMRDALNGIPDPIILDIGANIGHHSLFASTIAKEVHSFEPFPKVLAKLYEKIRVNSITNIKVHEIGLGETSEDLPFSQPVGCNTGTGSFVDASINNLNAINLPIRIGDEYLKTLKLHKIDFIKMDIEGFEPQALRGLYHTLNTYRPIVFFEWSANERKADIKLKTLFPNEYTIYNLTTNLYFLGLFHKTNYALIKESSLCCDGNKIAIPNERLNNIPIVKGKIIS